MRYFKFFTVIALCLFLSACGFRLRGSNFIPPQLHVVALHSTNPFGSFQKALRSTLIASGIKVDPSAPVVLDIVRDNFHYATTTVGSTVDPHAYRITYSAAYRITNRKGKVLLPTLAIAATRDYTLPGGQVFGTSNEVNVIKQELQREIIHQFFNTLGSENVRQALAKLN